LKGRGRRREEQLLRMGCLPGVGKEGGKVSLDFEEGKKRL
jgi:hypothetical protein